MGSLSVPQSFPFSPDEIKVVSKKGAPDEVVLTIEQFQRLLDLIEDLEDRADFVALKDTPTRDFDTFLKTL
jgi:hypothetical protein